MAETTTAADGSKVTRKKQYEPVDSDYELCNIGIDEAENGVVVTCRYNLKDDAKEKMKKASPDNYPSFYSYEGDGEKHVFEDKAAAQKFINDELTEMWG